MLTSTVNLGVVAVIVEIQCVFRETFNMWTEHISESPKPSFGISWHRHHRVSVILYQTPEYLPSDPCYGSHWTMYVSWASPSSSSCLWYSSLQQRKGPILCRCLGKLFSLSVKEKSMPNVLLQSIWFWVERWGTERDGSRCSSCRTFETCYTGITVNTRLWPCADNLQLWVWVARMCTEHQSCQAPRPHDRIHVVRGNIQILVLWLAALFIAGYMMNPKMIFSQ